MFGGHGLYSGNSFFGILVEGRIYFKVDETSRATFIERGTGPFTYLRATKTMTMNYYEVPPDVLENRNELADWAACAIKIAANSARKPRR